MATATADPARVHEQRMKALAEGNRIRLSRAALKRAIASGQRTLQSVLLEELPDYMEDVKVGDFLCYQRFIGTGRAVRLCGSVPVPITLPLGRLSPSTKARLVKVLDERDADR